MRMGFKEAEMKLCLG